LSISFEAPAVPLVGSSPRGSPGHDHLLYVYGKASR